MNTKPKLPKQLLKKWLSSCCGTVTFLKKDGTERVMRCTLKPELLPTKIVDESKATTQKRPENNNVLPVWDLDQNAFRSFQINSLISWEPDRE